MLKNRSFFAKSIQKTVILATMTLVIGYFSACNPTLATYDNSKKITQKDFESWIQSQYPGRQKFILSKLNYQYNIVREMVIMDLVYQQSEKDGLDKSKKFLDDWRSQKLYLQFKKYQNISQAFQRKLRSDQKNQIDLNEPVVKARHILFRVERVKKVGKKRVVLNEKEKKAEYLKALKKAKDVHKEVKKGKDFTELAKKYSEGPSKKTGGSLGYFTRYNMMVEPFAKAAFALNKGDVSEPIKTQYGYHIIKVEEKTKVTNDNLKKIFPTPSSQARLKQSHFNSYMKNLVVKLKKKAKVVPEYPGIKKKADEDLVLEIQDISLKKKEFARILSKLIAYKYPKKKDNLTLNDIKDEELKNYIDYFIKIYFMASEAKSKGSFNQSELDKYFNGEKKKFLSRFFFDHIAEKMKKIEDKEIHAEYNRRYTNRIKAMNRMNKKQKKGQKPTIPPFAKVKDTIKQQLQRNQKNRVIQKWINGKLKEKNFHLVRENFKVVAKEQPKRSKRPKMSKRPMKPRPPKHPVKK